MRRTHKPQPRALKQQRPSSPQRPHSVTPEGKQRPFASASLLQLQQQIGNTHVQRLLV
jgi:hypothetical protein